jgi:hypothetical protein
MQIRPSEQCEMRDFVMAHRSTAASIWTAVLAALVALLAFLGFGTKTVPARAAGTAVPAAPATPAARRPRFVARRTWRAMMRGGSLPPTIKQRIRAEAHGKTPSVRRSVTAASMGAAASSATVAATAEVAAGARRALGLAA